MKKILIAFSVLLFSFAIIPSQSANAGAFTCALGKTAGNPNRFVDVSYDINVPEGYGPVSGLIEFGDGGTWSTPSGGDEQTGGTSHEYPDESMVYSIGLGCDGGSAGYKYVTTSYTVTGSGTGTEYRCNDGLDNDNDGTCDYAGCNGKPRDEKCNNSAFSNAEPDSETGNGTWVRVVVNSNKQDASWRITCRPGLPYNYNDTPGDCSTFYQGSQNFGDLAGWGSYLLVAEEIPGYTVSVNGSGGSAFERFIPSDSGSNVTVDWTIQYTQVNENPTDGMSLSASPTQASEGDQITVTWGNESGLSQAGDYIAMVPVGGGWSGGWEWKYCNGSTVKPATACPTSGSMTFTAPAGVEAVEFVYYRNDRTDLEAVRSNQVTLLTSTPGQMSLACQSLVASSTWNGDRCIVPYGQNVNLRWAALGATGCAASGSWDGMQPATGTVQVGPITKSEAYTANCTWVIASGKKSHFWNFANAQETTSTVRTVFVGPDPNTIPTPQLNLECRQDQFAPWSQGPCQTTPVNRSIELRWNSTSTVSCTASSSPRFTNWTGSIGLGGTKTVSPILEPTRFSITCVGNGEEGVSVTREANVLITPTHATCNDVQQCVTVPGAGINDCLTNQECGAGAGVCNFKADPNRIVIPPTKQSTLSWECQNVHSCSISPVVGSVDPSGTAKVTPEATTKYELVCMNGEDTQVRDETVIRVFKFQSGSLKEVLP